MNKDVIQGILNQANTNLDKLIEEHKVDTQLFLDTFMDDLNENLHQVLRIGFRDSTFNPYEIYKKKILDSTHHLLTDAHRNDAVKSYRATGQSLKAMRIVVDQIVSQKNKRY